MTIEQKRFFGASIRSINCSIGWSNQPSQLVIDLVEDTVNGDSFNPTALGWPAYFEYYGFFFGGILQRSVRTGNFEGNPLYQVTLTDPREILAGVQVIIDGYTGATNVVPNLYNVYGFLENQAFGGAQTNDTGMPSNLIKNTLTTLIQQTPIDFRGQPFIIDLSHLPIMPDYHRVGGGMSISVLDFIDAVCVDGACDYFFKLVLTPLGHVIKVFTISRRNPPLLGAINNFIENNPECVSHERGTELRNEPTSKFIVGGPLEQLFLQTPSEEDDIDEIDYTDDNIVQSWGYKSINGSARLGEDNDVIVDEDDRRWNTKFDLNLRTLNITGLEDIYHTDVFEMRALLGGQASWETFLWLYNESTLSPHFHKANRIGLLGPVRQNIREIIDGLDRESLVGLDPKKLLPLAGKELGIAGGGVDKGILKENEIKRLYEALSSFAQEYYGRKWLVRIPFTLTKRDADTNLITTSQEPTNSGYVEESFFDNAVGLGYLPNESSLLLDEEDKIVAYVRYSDADQLDLTNISPEDYAFSPYQDDEGVTKYYVFIRCTLEPKLTFIDKTTGFGPRAIITMPGPVFPKLGEDASDFAGVLRPIFEARAIAVGLTEIQAEAIANSLFKKPGAEQLMFPTAGIAVMPDLVAVPLKSNIATYGPWFVEGAPGGVSVVQEPSLVPWNYGGYEFMNLAAQALVDESISQQQIAETGSIEVVGAPSLSIGDELISGGPYVTSINITISSGGVTTIYRMETWTQRWGRTYKQNIERINRITRAVLDQRRILRNRQREQPQLEVLLKRKNVLEEPPERIKRGSSMGFIAGQIDKNETTGFSTSNVTFLPSYHLGAQIAGDYDKKAAMSLDGLLVPFSTSVNASGMPHYETPTSSGVNGRSVLELNPFASGHNIFATLQNSGINDEQSLDTQFSSNVRAFALRGPIIIAGWGYDSNGKPVPNRTPDNPGDLFASGHLQKTDAWKVGPLATEWDNDRKVWLAGGGGKFSAAELITSLNHGSFASGYIVEPRFNAQEQLLRWTRASGQAPIRIYDGLIGTTNSILFPIAPSGSRVYIQQEKSSNKYFITSAGVY